MSRTREPSWIPFSAPDIGEAEMAAAAECLRAGWLTTGPRTAELEQRFADQIGVRHAIGVSSATAALHLALEGLGVGPGDRVITSDLTFTATAEAITLCGAEPVLVDVDPATLNLDPAAVARALARTERVRAILPVHFAGLPCAMDALRALAAEHGAVVVEDAAHAFPARTGGRMAGALGDAAAFSLYANKPLGAGEGGLLTTDDDALAAWARRARLHGVERAGADERGARWRYEVVTGGYKYNLPDLMAAIALPQLERAEANRERRRAIAARYRAALAGAPVTLPPEGATAADHAWHLFVIRLETERLRIDRDGFIAELASAGVGASVHFIPLHRHRFWRERLGLDSETFPVAADAGERVLSLPLYPALTDDQLTRVADTVTELLRRYGG